MRAGAASCSAACSARCSPSRAAGGPPAPDPDRTPSTGAASRPGWCKQACFEIVNLAVAREAFTHDDAGALRPRHHVDHGHQLAVGAARDFAEHGERGRLADVIAGERVRARVVQRDLVVIAGHDGLEIAAEPGGGVALDDGEIGGGPLLVGHGARLERSQHANHDPGGSDAQAAALLVSSTNTSSRSGSSMERSLIATPARRMRSSNSSTVCSLVR
jgi:hypothetical protein